MADEEPQQSGENKSTAKIDDDEPQLVAGRKPAGKIRNPIFFPQIRPSNSLEFAAHLLKVKVYATDIAKSAVIATLCVCVQLSDCVCA